MLAAQENKLEQQKMRESMWPLPPDDANALLGYCIEQAATEVEESYLCEYGIVSVPNALYQYETIKEVIWLLREQGYRANIYFSDSHNTYILMDWHNPHLSFVCKLRMKIKNHFHLR